MIALSIVICSYNRAALLLNNFKKIEQLKPINPHVEFILIDNNSTDTTQEIIDGFKNEIPNFSSHIETKQGLSFARNRGYSEAKGDYVAYIDDDAQLTSGWIEKALKIIAEQKPDAFGGPIYPFYLHKKPDWFSDEYEIRRHSEETGWLNNRQTFSGSNMVFKKDILIKFHGFDTSLGMQGNKLAYGEETELMNRMHQNSCKLYYDLDLIIEHWVPEFKTDLTYQMYYAFKNPANHFEIYKPTKKLPKESISDELVESLFQTFSILEAQVSLNKKNIDFKFEAFYMNRLNGLFLNISRLMQQYKINDERINRNFFEKAKTFSIEKVMFILKNKFAKIKRCK